MTSEYWLTPISLGPSAGLRSFEAGRRHNQSGLSRDASSQQFHTHTQTTYNSKCPHVITSGAQCPWGGRIRVSGSSGTPRAAKLGTGYISEGDTRRICKFMRKQERRERRHSVASFAFRDAEHYIRSSASSAGPRDVRHRAQLVSPELSNTGLNVTTTE
jgi:hypothetical protein